MTTLSNEQVFAELYYTGKIIKTVLGVTPRCWHPPLGDVDDRVRKIADALGYRTILWQEDTDDWELGTGQASKDEIENNYEGIAKKASNESPVVLSHEINEQTMDMFKDMYPKIDKAYDHIVPLTACLNVKHPYTENIEYPDFKAFTSGKIDPKGAPSLDDIKVDPKAKFSPEPLSKQKDKGTYANPGKSSGKGDSDGHNAAMAASAGLASLVTPLAAVLAFL